MEIFRDPDNAVERSGATLTPFKISQCCEQICLILYSCKEKHKLKFVFVYCVETVIMQVNG